MRGDSCPPCSPWPERNPDKKLMEVAHLTSGTTIGISLSATSLSSVQDQQLLLWFARRVSGTGLTSLGRGSNEVCQGQPEVPLLAASQKLSAVTSFASGSQDSSLITSQGRVLKSNQDCGQ